MRRTMISCLILLFLMTVAAQAQWRSKTHDMYNALQKPADIKIDGDLEDKEGWEGVFETVKGTDGKIFCGVEYEGNVFQPHGGGNWKGPDDHETCFAIVWEPDAIYIALSVTDDEHEHAAAAAWNGDGAQLAFEMTGKRSAGIPMGLYNIGLDDDGKNILPGALNERPLGGGIVAGEDIAVVRNENEKQTYYELRFTAKEINQNQPFTEGFKFGLGICVNDGDKAAGQGGQKGWSGWYTHSIVFGKNSEKTGLVVLTDETLSIDPLNKITTTWGNIKSLK
ncbi:hypothetical protein C6497_14405 [Candidatus Poribacteria bacterium]|nr:MAG: hypothetical protein C6497_14405 [Candidatus Poribacteria bacterium]